VWWQPPDFNDPGNAWLPHHQIGSPSPYVETARSFADVVASAGGIYVEPLAAHLPATVHLWRSGGRTWLLAGNLETGWIGDSRLPRALTVCLPLGMGATVLIDDVDGSIVEPDGEVGNHVRFSFEIPPESFRRFTVEVAR